jgi:hypothetical protein
VTSSCGPIADAEYPHQHGLNRQVASVLRRTRQVIAGRFRPAANHTQEIESRWKHEHRVHACVTWRHAPQFRRSTGFRKPGTTPGNVKLLLPPRQSRGISHYISRKTDIVRHLNMALLSHIFSMSRTDRRYKRCGLGTCPRHSEAGSSVKPNLALRAKRARLHLLHEPRPTDHT